MTVQKVEDTFKIMSNNNKINHDKMTYINTTILRQISSQFNVYQLIQVGIKMCAGMAQLVWRLAMGWAVWRSNPSGGGIFRTPPDRSLGSNQPAIEWVLGFPRG
jgi:hypothetical protein